MVALFFDFENGYFLPHLQTKLIQLLHLCIMKQYIWITSLWARSIPSWSISQESSFTPSSNWVNQFWQQGPIFFHWSLMSAISTLTIQCHCNNSLIAALIIQSNPHPIMTIWVHNVCICRPHPICFPTTGLSTLLWIIFQHKHIIHGIGPESLMI